MEWTEAETKTLISMHGRVPRKEIERVLGRSHGSVRGKITELGIGRPVRWSNEHVNMIRDLYEKAAGGKVINLKAFAASIGKDAVSVCQKARLMGLETNQSRRLVESRKVYRKYDNDEERKARSSEAKREWIRLNGHPRGMAGKTHTQEVKDTLRVKSAEAMAKLSPDQRAERATKSMKTKLERYGSLAPKTTRGTWKAGWREIGGKRNYYRSRWEANYARYLQWLKDGGHIKEWEHEPETFWFETIKRGVRSYLPDFRVWENDGSSILHEVKGWMDSRSKTTISRMRKYHPQHKLLVVDGKQYRAIRLKVMAMIPGWEDSERDGRS